MTHICLRRNVVPKRPSFAALDSRTEGWIAGLQLAAISLQGQENITQQIQSFTGSNRLVLDYLIEEVLNRQTEEIQHFLLQTAVLDRLTGPLCDVVRFGSENQPDHAGERASGQAILEFLDRANLFIIPLDNENRWYRYHHLFVDLLRNRLRQTKQAQERTLYSRASMWFEQNGYADEAVEYALLAEDYSRSAALIVDLADPLWRGGSIDGGD